MFAGTCKSLSNPITKLCPKLENFIKPYGVCLMALSGNRAFAVWWLKQSLEQVLSELGSAHCCKAPVCRSIFETETVFHFSNGLSKYSWKSTVFAETFRSVRHFGHLSQLYQNSPLTCLFIYFQTFWPKWLSFGHFKTFRSEKIPAAKIH